MQQHIKYAVMNLDDLEPFGGNARTHDDGALRTSIKVHGQYRTLVVRETDDGRHVIVAGNGTAEAMKAKGHTKARVELMTCTDEDALQINLMDNRSNDLAGYDAQAMAEQLAAVREMNLWEGTGWDVKAAAKYLEEKEEDGGEEYVSRWEVVVECKDEEDQRLIYEQLTAEGRTCRVLAM